MNMKLVIGVEAKQQRLFDLVKQGDFVQVKNGNGERTYTGVVRCVFTDSPERLTVYVLHDSYSESPPADDMTFYLSQWELVRIFSEVRLIP